MFGAAYGFIFAAVVVWALYFFPSDPWFYLKGLATVNQDHDPGYFAYLMGELRPGRWYSYFLIAYLVKTPIPSLILLAAAGVVFFRGRRAALLDEAFLLIPALAFFVGYSLTADNLGVRYLIPCYPFLMIFTARLGPAVEAGKSWAKTAMAALLVWMIVEFAVIWPDHLAYFKRSPACPRRDLAGWMIPTWIGGRGCCSCGTTCRSTRWRIFISATSGARARSITGCGAARYRSRISLRLPLRGLTSSAPTAWPGPARSLRVPTGKAPETGWRRPFPRPWSAMRLRSTRFGRGIRQRACIRIAVILSQPPCSLARPTNPAQASSKLPFFSWTTFRMSRSSTMELNPSEQSNT